MKQNPSYDYCNIAITLPCRNRTLIYSNAVESTHFIINVLIAAHKVFNRIMSFRSKAIEIATFRAFTITFGYKIAIRGIVKGFRSIAFYITKTNKFISGCVTALSGKAVRINDCGNCKIKVIQAVGMNIRQEEHLRFTEWIFKFKSPVRLIELRNKKKTLFHLVWFKLLIGMANLVVSKVRKTVRMLEWLI